MNPEDYDEASTVYSETEFPRKCGFCRHRFESRQERIDHIAGHFKQGKSMLEWRDEEDNDDSADDDDDNDRPDGDSFDGAPSSQSPDSDSRGNHDSKYFGNNDSGSGGSTGQPTQGGFFQFQLSQLGESQLYCADQPTRPITPSPNISQSSTSPESDGTMSHCEHISTKEDDTTALARDAITQTIRGKQETSSLGKESNSRLAEHPHWKYARTSVEPEVPSPFGMPSLNFPTLPEEGLPAGKDIHCPESSTDVMPRGKSPVGVHIPQIPKKSRSFLSIRLLGAGGFSTVDEVIHQQTGLHVGRKTLKNRDRTAIEELKKEVSVLQKLRHPHIIRFLGAYAKGDKMSILLSPVAETTLAGWLERVSSQQPTNLLKTIVKMFGCLTSSVRYIHEQRPVVKHMDIKPQNILIVGSDQEIPHVILCDFGVSSAEDVHDHHSKPLTRQYVAPEVFEGFVRKQAADIWSLGCVFSEMASVPLGQDSTSWSAFRKEFSGRTGKYYWQDVPGVQEKLSSFLDTAKTATEQTVVRTIQSMMDANPDKRPDAASLTLVFTPAPCCLDWPNDKTIFPGPHEEYGGVDAFAHEDIIEHYGHERETTAYSDSLSSAKTWLEDCQLTHDACHHVPTGDFSTLPTRLVDMLPDGQAGSYVRIVESDMLQPTIDPVEYVALSHVWNFSQPLLSSSSLPGMQTELDLQKLPTTVRRGISAAQRLGYRYCWLDALCVLQDSWQQKELECKGMSSTFRNAALTVVLDQLGSDDDDDGDEYENTDKGISGTTNHHHSSLPGSPAGRHTAPARLPASALLPSSILAAPNFGWDTRAWVLQGRLLSRRFLHLGKQLYWECNTLKASETFPCGLSPLVWEKVHTICTPPEPSSRRPASPAMEAAKVKSKIHHHHHAPEHRHLTLEADVLAPSTSRIQKRQWGTCIQQGDHTCADIHARSRVHMLSQGIEQRVSASCPHVRLPRHMPDYQEYTKHHHDAHHQLHDTSDHVQSIATAAKVDKHKEQASCPACPFSSCCNSNTGRSSSSSKLLQHHEVDTAKNGHCTMCSSRSRDRRPSSHIGNGSRSDGDAAGGTDVFERQGME